MKSRGGNERERAIPRKINTLNSSRKRRVPVRLCCHTKEEVKVRGLPVAKVVCWRGQMRADEGR